MPKLVSISAKTLIKALKKINFEIVSQKGSHIKLVRESKQERKVLVIPNHKVLKKGTLTAIIKQAGISKTQLQNLIK